MFSRKFLQLIFLIPILACANSKEQKANEKNVEKLEIPDTVLAGQTIMVSGGQLGRSNQEISGLVAQGKIGGVIFLKSNKVEILKAQNVFDSIAESKNLPPLIYATDAEPGMFNKKVSGVTPTPYNSELQDLMAVKAAATSISEDLYSLGMRWNFAPVCDVSLQNEAIGKRSFSEDPEIVKEFSLAFSKTSQKEGIAATAKHFPGHGSISGDTHLGLATISGEFKELQPFKALIDAGVDAVMIGHIAVEDNPYSTNSLPASCSERIIKDLLVDSLGFKGVIVTDAMNMGAIRTIEEPEILSLEAGANLILMPRNPDLTYEKIIKKMKEDPSFLSKVQNSGNKVLELKRRYLQ